MWGVKLWGLLGAAVLGLSPSLAVHPELQRSEPAQDTTVQAVPAELRLTFTEGVDPDLSEVRLVVEGGGEYPLVLSSGADPVELVASVPAATAPGLWTVHWRVMGADAHPVRGTYSFRVEAPVAVPLDSAAPADPPAQFTQPAEEEPLGVGSPAFVAARWITFVSMLTAIGAVAFRFLVLHPARMRAPALVAAMEAAASGAARLGRGAALFLALAAVVRLLLQFETLGGGDLQLLRDLLFASSWGQAWFIQVGSALLALLGFHIALGGGQAGWGVAALATPGIALGASLASHAASADLPVLGVTADALHTLAVSGWLGALLVLVVAGFPALLREGAPSGKFSAVAAVIGAFSPRALLMAGIAVVTGTLGALLHLTSVASLWQTPYGRMLLLKLARVGTVAALGAWNWRRMKPRLDAGDAPERLRRTAAAELFMGALVLLATAILVALPTP
jgi:copper transport protein